MRFRHLVALAAALAGFGSAAALAEGWRTYANDRFGATVDYPDRFSVLDTPPANSDGQRFFTPDRRARMAVYGSFNTTDETARQLMDSSREAGVAYSYADARADSYALSGRKADRVLYRRCIRSTFSRDIFNCVDLEYPAGEANEWDAAVTRISRSLRSGRPWS